MSNKQITVTLELPDIVEIIGERNDNLTPIAIKMIVDYYNHKSDGRFDSIAEFKSYFDWFKELSISELFERVPEFHNEPYMYNTELAYAATYNYLVENPSNFELIQYIQENGTCLIREF